ncbi:MAG: conjugal transfer protein TraG N-terminal domain-containing protein [Proteobacteria bacterium]|nr:conjugal transfer protein TraG N-terminal domain-containing protein [Pseudomonadota bacterium]
MMRKLLITLLCVFISKDSFAALPASIKTFTTWGDFDVVYNTFLKISLLMSDARYHDVYISVMVLSMVLGFAAILVRNMGSSAGTSGVLRLFGVIIMGVIIYKTFIKPTDTILIYDETLNLQGTVGGVPEGLILIAGLSNKIEKGFVDLIWTASGPGTYKESPGGMVFNLMKNAFSGGVNLTSSSGPGAYIEVNIRNYVDDCLIRELSRPGTAININDFNQTSNFLNILSNAQSDSWFTVWQDDTNKAGISQTCTQSWTGLNNFFATLTPASPLVDKFYKEKCGKSGLSQPLGATGTDVDQTCRAMLQNMVGNIIGAGVTTSQLMIQYLISHQLWLSFKEGDVKGVANYQTGTSMQGMAEMANDWIPIIRGMVFSVFVGLFPFICLLMVTPMFSKAVSFVLGAFVFLTAWGVCDALIHSFAMEKGLALMTDIGNGSLGIKSMLLFEDRGAKALAVFGAARWSAIMIAGVLSAIIAGFGGNAMAHLASQLSASKQTGAQAATSLGNPEQRAAKMSGLEGAVPVQTLSNHYGFNRMNQAELYRRSEGVATSLKSIDAFGGPGRSAIDAGERVANANVINRAGSVAGAEEMKMSGSVLTATNNARKSVAQAGVEINNAKKIGTTAGLQNTWNADATEKVLNHASEEDIVNQQAQDKLTAVDTANKLRKEYGGDDVSKTADVLSHSNMVSTGQNIGYGSEFSSEEAYDAGSVRGIETKANTEAVKNLSNKFGWDALYKSADIAKQREYVSAQATEYYGQALKGSIDPTLKQEAAYINSTPEGRQLWQQYSHGSYSNLSAQEAKDFEQISGVPVKEHDNVAVDWAPSPETGELGISNMRVNNVAMIEKGKMTNIYDEVEKFHTGRQLIQDAPMDRLFHTLKSIHIEKGMSEEAAEKKAYEECKTIFGNIDVGHKIANQGSIAGGIATSLTIMDTVEGKDTVFSAMIPMGDPVKIRDEIKNGNPLPLFLRNHNQDKGL